MFSASPPTRTARRVFLFSFLIGLFWILIAVWTDSSTARLCAVAVMVIYWLWVAQQIETAPNAEEYADSIYYLGFLFTLVALAATGFKHYGSGGPKPDNTTIIQQFLLGLTTTVVGLAGKIYFAQFRSIPVEDVAAAHQRLADAMSRIVPQLEDSFEYLRKTRERSTQEMTKIADESNKMVRVLIEQTTDTVEAVSSLAIKRIDTVFKDFEKRVSDIQIPPHIFTDKIRQTLGEVATELDQVKEAVKNFNALARRQSKATEALVESTDVSAAKFSEFADSANSLSAFSLKVKDLQISADNLNNAVALVSSQLSAYSSQLGTHTEASVALRSELERELENIRNRKADIEKEVQQAQDALQLVHRNLIDSTKFIAQQLGG